MRVKDLDFSEGLVFVRSAKEDPDRTTVLPRVLVRELQTHLQRVRALHQADLAEGNGAVELPGRLAERYPSAARGWG